MKIALTICFTFITVIATACSCIGVGSVEKSFKEADYIIQGAILKYEMIYNRSLYKIKTDGTSEIDTLSWPYNLTISKYTVLVQVSYKGKLESDTLNIYTGNGGGDCGYNFVIGDVYLIYGYENTYLYSDYYDGKKNKHDLIITTNICTRTQRYDEDEANNLKELSK